MSITRTAFDTICILLLRTTFVVYKPVLMFVNRVVLFVNRIVLFVNRVLFAAQILAVVRIKSRCLFLAKRRNIMLYSIALCYVDQLPADKPHPQNRLCYTLPINGQMLH